MSITLRFLDGKTITYNTATKMQRTRRTRIEWVKNPDGTQGYTWNPVTGCLHGCPYCYAHRMARRFGKTQEEKDFKPVFHPQRLADPQRIKKPSTIFVCSMADLFGEWVPEKWIKEIMIATREAPQHQYLFLTKNPKRYKHLLPACWPAKYMVGVTCEGDIHGIATGHHPDYSFISFEPLLKYTKGLHAFLPILHHDFSWVIVGAQTGPNAVKPQREWVESIIRACRETGTPLFLKDNLNWPEKIQEVP